MAPDKATCFRHKTMTPRCPVSGRQVTWRRFCYLVGERTTDWPRED